MLKSEICCNLCFHLKLWVDPEFGMHSDTLVDKHASNLMVVYFAHHSYAKSS